MSKLNEKELLKELDKAVGFKVAAYKQIRELIKIFFAKEISAGPIKKDIPERDLIEWLQGLNQAATAMKDYYVMKATTQLIEMMQEIGMDKIFVEKKARELMDLFRRGKEEHDELPLHTAINIVRFMQKPEIRKDWLPTPENINALPEPVRKYIADLETNVDPASMVQENALLRDTCKALEIKFEEKAVQLPEITEAWTDAKAKEIKALIKDAQDEDLSDSALDLHYLGLSLDIVDSILEELGVKINKAKKRRGGCPPDFIPGKED